MHLSNLFYAFFCIPGKKIFQRTFLSYFFCPVTEYTGYNDFDIVLQLIILSMKRKFPELQARH